MHEKPNILIIQADQLTALCLAAYGKPLALTPNIDKIAARHHLYQHLLQILFVDRHVLA